MHALLKKAVLQEKEKAAAADLKVKQLSLELHRKNEEQVLLLEYPHRQALCITRLEQDVLVFNNTRLVRRVEALQEQLQQARHSVLVIYAIS